MPSPLWDKIRGIVGNLFTLGNDETSSNSLKSHADGVEMTNFDGTVRKNAVVARPQGANQNDHASTYLDVKERAIVIEFSFAGGSPPAPGTNTGKYGMCHTSGGSYSAGQIYLDTGSALGAIPMYKGLLASPNATFSGTVGMSLDNVYHTRSAVAPFGWTMIGGEAHEIGEPSTIEIPFDFNDIGTPKSSTQNVPAGARILFTRVIVDTTFTGGANPTLLVEVDGASDTTLSATNESNLRVAGEYANRETIDIESGYEGPVRLTLGGTATAGAGSVLVQWCSPGS